MITHWDIFCFYIYESTALPLYPNNYYKKTLSEITNKPCSKAIEISFSRARESLYYSKKCKISKTPLEHS